MVQKRDRDVASRTFSASELKDGNEKLLAVKREAESEEELKKKIKEAR